MKSHEGLINIKKKTKYLSLIVKLVGISKKDTELWVHHRIIADADIPTYILTMRKRKSVIFVQRGLVRV